MTGQTPIIPNDVFQKAVQGFWDTRIAQAQAQVLAGKVDQGNRSAAGGGKQMDGFILTLLSTSGQLTGKGCLAQHLGHRG
jgi:hypothetical protein